MVHHKSIFQDSSTVSRDVSGSQLLQSIRQQLTGRFDQNNAQIFSLDHAHPDMAWL
jgi:hypothetical protein